MSLQAPAAAEPAPLAMRNHDLILICPYCSAIVLRTTAEDFEGSEVRCTRPTCRQMVRISNGAVRGRAYFCKIKSCHAFLFASPTPVGRAWIRCPNPTCLHAVTAQVVYLGERRGINGRGGTGPPRRIVGRARVVIG